MSTWITVALDLVAKIRQLAEAGEPAAAAFAATLDRAIANDDVQGIGKLERELLSTCRDTFELIGQREHEELSRLVRDRNVCAHPAFVSPDKVFTPTAELSRVHLTVAVDTVLRHGATPGRKAIERFFTEAKGTAWPEGVRPLAEHLRARYFDRGTEALRRNLTMVVVKGCLNPPEGDEKLYRRMTRTAHAIDSIAPRQLEEAFDQVVRRKEESTGLTDTELIRMTGALGDIQTLWEALPGTSHPGVEAAINNAPLDQLIDAGVLSITPSHSGVASAVSDRLTDLSADELGKVIARRRGGNLVDVAIKHLADSGGWRTAEKRMRDLIMPLARYLDLRSLKAIHQVLRENEQVRMAGEVPPMISTLFTETTDIAGAVDAWRQLSDWLQTQGRDGSTSDYYAYPDLAQAVRTTESG